MIALVFISLYLVFFAIMFNMIGTIMNKMGFSGPKAELIRLVLAIFSGLWFEFGIPLFILGVVLNTIFFRNSNKGAPA